eukprot:TRINITY_DN31108_c0_g2_i4.p2 TRINITY_DN31108_c0_g2~~TRINITY_DN31108_c0_g2_i4.p2  ORF type:complete len:257 (+),score=-11.42 TRINITY_DN31108_c0_g2_i4:630-1400(+)
MYFQILISKMLIQQHYKVQYSPFQSYLDYQYFKKSNFFGYDIFSELLIYYFVHYLIVNKVTNQNILQSHQLHSNQYKKLIIRYLKKHKKIQISSVYSEKKKVFKSKLTETFSQKYIYNKVQIYQIFYGISTRDRPNSQYRRPSLIRTQASNSCQSEQKFLYGLLMCDLQNFRIYLQIVYFRRIYIKNIYCKRSEQKYLQFSVKRMFKILLSDNIMVLIFKNINSVKQPLQIHLFGTLQFFATTALKEILGALQTLQ